MFSVGFQFASTSSRDTLICSCATLPVISVLTSWSRVWPTKDLRLAVLRSDLQKALSKWAIPIQLKAFLWIEVAHWLFLCPLATAKILYPLCLVCSSVPASFSFASLLAISTLQCYWCPCRFFQQILADVCLAFTRFEFPLLLYPH